MGVHPSKTELFLPSQTLRECHPDRCWCDQPYHRSSRYVYVERRGDGTERFQDPVDLLQQCMLGGGGGGGAMPWKDPRSWTVRDYEKLGEVMEEWAGREYGKNPGGANRGGAGYPPWPGAQQQQQQQGGGGGHWDGEYASRAPPHGSGGARRSSSRRYVGWDQFEELKASFQRMAEQYQRHMSEQDAFLFGSDADRRKEQYRQNMLSQLKEMLPQLVEMMGGGVPAHLAGMQQQQQQQQQMPPPGVQLPYPMMPPGAAIPGMQMPMPMSMPPPQAQQNPMQAATAAMHGMGMGMGMGMDPMAAAAMMNPMMMHNGANVPMMMPNNTNNGMMAPQPPPPNMSRRARRRNGFAIDDGFDDEQDEFRPRRGGFNRRGGGGGGGAGNWRDDDDMLGGYAAGGLRGPRGGGGGGGGGGMAFEDFHSRVPSRYGHASTARPHPTTRGLAEDSVPGVFSRLGYSTAAAAADSAARNEARRRNNMMPTADSVYDGNFAFAGGDPGLDPPATVHSPTPFRRYPEFSAAAAAATASSYNTPQLSRRHATTTTIPTYNNDPGGTAREFVASDSPAATATTYTSTAAPAGCDGSSFAGLKSALKRNVSFDREKFPRRPRHGEESSAGRGETSAGAALPNEPEEGVGML